MGGLWPTFPRVCSVSRQQGAEGSRQASSKEKAGAPRAGLLLTPCASQRRAQPDLLPLGAGGTSEGRTLLPQGSVEGPSHLKIPCPMLSPYRPVCSNSGLRISPGDRDVSRHRMTAGGLERVAEKSRLFPSLFRQCAEHSGALVGFWVPLLRGSCHRVLLARVGTASELPL